MKIKNTKKLALDGEFQQFKITVESEGEAVLLCELIGALHPFEQEAFGLSDSMEVYKILRSKVGYQAHIYPALTVTMENNGEQR